MIRVIKRKRKRNPTLRKEVLRQVAELLAKTLYYNRAEYFYLAQELVERKSVYCEQCMSGNIASDCDWDICFPEIYNICENCDIEMVNCHCDVKDLAEDLAEELGIEKRWLEVFIYSFQKIELVPHGSFRKINFHIRDLSNLDLSCSTFERINFENVDLSNSDLSCSGLMESNFKNADLSNSNLTDVTLSSAILINANLSNSVLEESVSRETNFTNANLSNVNLSSSVLTNANFTEANLSNASLMETDLTNANFTKSDLFKTDFTESALDRAKFTDAKHIDKAINLRIPNPKGSIMLKKKKTTTKKISKKTTAKKVSKKTTTSRKRNPDHVIDRKIAHTEDELDWAIDSGDRAAARVLERRLEALEFARGVYASEDSKVRNPRKKITKRKSTTCKKCKCKNCKCR